MRKLVITLAETVLPHRVMLGLRARRAISRGDNPELMLLSRLARGGTFADIGANIGDWSRVASLHFPQVVAFEPIPELAAKLRRELGSKAVVHAVALSDRAGIATLSIPRHGNGSEVTGLASLLAQSDEGLAVGMRALEVPTATLDSFGLSRVDVIKIDVEGFEGPVLVGARGTITRDLPALIVEIEDRHHPGETLSVFRQLWDHGYVAFGLREGRLRRVGLDRPEWADVPRDEALINLWPDGSRVINFVFLHPSEARQAALAAEAA
jgi:FkbM family methyltransferase